MLLFQHVPMSPHGAPSPRTTDPGLLTHRYSAGLVSLLTDMDQGVIIPTADMTNPSRTMTRDIILSSPKSATNPA